MPTRSRLRRRFDVNRLRMAQSGPEADSRTWVALARVDSETDAIRWDAVLGWIVDVTFVSGPLSNEGPVSCRVASSFEGRLDPIAGGCLVLVVLPDGDANVDPCILGVVHVGPDCVAPTTVNGDPIDLAKVQGAHVLVTEHDVEWQVGGDARLVAAGQTVLADAQATQSYVRGEDQRDALEALADALDAVISALAVAPVNIGGAVVALDPASLTQFKAAVAQFKAADAQYLSVRIKGE